MKSRLLVFILAISLVLNVIFGFTWIVELKENQKTNERSVNNFISTIDSSKSIAEDLLLERSDDNKIRTFYLLNRLKRLDAILEYNENIYYSNYFHRYSLILEESIISGQLTEDFLEKIELLKANFEEVLNEFSNGGKKNIVELDRIVRTIIAPNETFVK